MVLSGTSMKGRHSRDTSDSTLAAIEGQAGASVLEPEWPWNLMGCSHDGAQRSEFASFQGQAQDVCALMCNHSLALCAGRSPFFNAHQVRNSLCQ